jgi:hypothetical protein
MSVVVVEGHNQQRLTLLIWCPAFSEAIETGSLSPKNLNASVKVKVKRFK